MITNTVSHLSPSDNGTENLSAPRKTTEERMQGAAVFSIRIILRGLYILLTLLIGLAAILPDSLGIPLDLRPWIFLTSVLWFVVFCAGISSS